jgi:hypothetical protein
MRDDGIILDPAVERARGMVPRRPARRNAASEWLSDNALQRSRAPLGACRGPLRPSPGG